MRILLTLGLLAVGTSAACTPVPPTDPAGTYRPVRPTQPHFSARRHEAEYVGPGREIPAPGDVGEVRIGYFGPADAGHATAGDMWSAATMAVEEANRDGGYEGKPFRLLPTWSENPWGTGVRGVTRLVYEEELWAIVGAPDGPSAHLVEQVVAKARVPFISPVATDKTTNLANVPWIFSCAPGDHLLAPLLAEALTASSDDGDLAVLTCTDHDSRMFTTELLAALHGRQTFPSLRLEFRPGLTDFASQLETLHDQQPAAIAVVAGPADSARAVCAIRQAGLTQPIYGGPTMGHRRFAEAAGAAAEGVVFPLLWGPATSGESAERFAQRFVDRYGFEPDYTAAHAYDAVSLLIAAIRQAGLNRAHIRDAVRELSPYAGVTGQITWDPTGHNLRPVGLGVVSDGLLRPIRQYDTTETLRHGDKGGLMKTGER